MARLYRNDYQWRENLRIFANTNPIGRLVKPIVRGVYRWIDSLLPQPRDFLLRRVRLGSKVCEVGVYEGIFSQRILDIVRPSSLVLIDPWAEIPNSKQKYDQAHQEARYEAARTRLARGITGGSVEIIRDTSDNAAVVLATRAFDLIYIDGDHSYAQVSSDIANYWPLVTTGGILAGDDYRISDIARAVAEHCELHHVALEVKNDQFILIKR
ncbi:MAG: class I SAM-dependent methyltransferase [Patescibacteria group bacterium]